MQGMAQDGVRTRHARRARLLVAIAVGALALPATPALAQDESPVTLRLAVADQQGRPSTPAVDAFVAAANELSDGSITIEPLWDAGVDTELGFEQGTAKRLVDGDVELALAASRGWEPVGIASFRALQAPFLIDDDALAVAVSQSDAATGMLESLGSHGLTGLALWPEDLRHPATILDCAEPIVAPEQFAGLTVRAIASGVSYDLLETLGATPVSDDWDGCTIQATESGLQQGLSLPSGVTFTGDVTFFPKFQVLAASTATLDRLSDDQRQVLHDAAAAARDAALAARVSDADAGEAWCAEGGRVVLAGPDGIAAFKAAAQPVYERLVTDPVAAEAIAAITELKGTVEPAPGPVACGAAPVLGAPIDAATQPTPIDGTYVTHVSLEELSSSPLLYDRGEINDGNWGDITLTFDSGTFTQTLKNPNETYAGSGTYTVEGDLLTVFDPNACCPAQPFSWRWRLDGDTLILSRDPDYVGPTPWIINPWTRVAAAPPATTSVTPPEGTWRIDVTRDAMESAGLSPEWVDNVAALYTWTFAASGDGDNGTYTLTAESPSWDAFTCDGEYEVQSDGRVLMRFLTISNCGGAEMLWAWSEDADGNGRVQVSDTPGWDVTVDRAMWQSAPFVRID